MTSRKSINKSSNWQLLINILLALFITISGISCTQQQEESTREVPSDETIANTIKTQLVSAADVRADSITVDVKQGVATISGTTSNLLAKRRATEIARSTLGVLSVVNNLRITTERSDEALQQDLYAALRSDPATENWEVNVTVNNGLVRLSGSVDSWQEKNLTETVIAGVKGVENIENMIQVTPAVGRSAGDIKAEIKSNLMYDSQIRDNRINVEVDSSTVSLSGTVGSVAEKQRAIENCYVTGVNDVNAEALEVKPEIGNQLLVNEQTKNTTPSEIENAINRSYSYDPRVPADSISVSFEDSTATLTGSVVNLNAKLAAVDNALNTVGVNEVVNNIEVQKKVVVEPGVPTTDEGIKSRIVESINRDPYVEEARLKVMVNDGIVTLEGDVNSEFEKEQIHDITQRVKGVLAINNNLTVDSENNSEM